MSEALLRRVAEVVAAVLEAQYIPSWVKVLFPELTYFSAKDEWRYLAIMDDRTCPDCAPRDGRKYFGDGLRSEFPWLMVDGSDSISPRVHPNCRCIMLREAWLHENKVKI